ncbi:hypothetical protein A6A04_14310 [Paramagnetospirillum marisnigri]|uniref:Peptidase M48 domain-containing protein n=1 Tax=Paramagnetospirillum marisnigri TaxID=1285242 RepID=A0A178MU12_9PROT|nr:M48 family metallopeptidase [Paramagnetospirillum marisnigri]OAN53131.1 hypothetical protein A6A04_14310 [Paramagnetospirillum marisnigri]
MDGPERSSPGRFNDGRNAASRRVRVSAVPEGLGIRGEDGFLVAVWRLGDVEREAAPGAEVRLRCVAEPAARLTLEDAGFADWVLPPTLPRRRSHGTLRMVVGLALGALVLLALAQALPGLSRYLVAFVPVETERAWGRSMAQGFESRFRVCRDGAGLAAMERLTARLAQGLPPDYHRVTLRVVDSPVVNALALPGAEIVVFRGLMVDMEHPDELAGVLAHELTHVGERHPTVAVMRGVGVGILVTLVTGDASGLVASAASALMAAAYSRDDEAAADRGAVALLTRAGIGHAGLAAFFRRLDRQEGGSGSLVAWIGTHPDSAVRAAAVEAAPLPRSAAPSMSEGEWSAVKSMCGG